MGGPLNVRHALAASGGFAASAAPATAGLRERKWELRRSRSRSHDGDHSGAHYSSRQYLAVSSGIRGRRAGVLGARVLEFPRDPSSSDRALDRWVFPRVPASAVTRGAFLASAVPRRHRRVPLCPVSVRPRPWCPVGPSRACDRSGFPLNFQRYDAGTTRSDTRPRSPPAAACAGRAATPLLASSTSSPTRS
jgi:hypothetical protein